MKESIAIVPWPCHMVIHPRLYKRNLLYFDKIATTMAVGMEYNVILDFKSPASKLIPELMKNGLFVNMEIPKKAVDKLRTKKEFIDYNKLISKFHKKEYTKKSVFEYFEEYYGLYSRFDSYILHNTNIQAFPLLSASAYESKNILTTKTNIIQIVINSLPIPSDDTPIEQLIEFKQDRNSRHKFLALRNWINETSHLLLSPNEIQEKIEYLINDYQVHIKLHKMKTEMGKLETIITTGAEIIDDLVHLKFGSAAKLFFSINKHNLELFEAELKSPGSELAFIVKAQNEFN